MNHGFFTGKWKTFLCWTLLVVVSPVINQTISTSSDAVPGRPFTLECRINRLSTDCNPSCSPIYWGLTDGSDALYSSRTCRSSIPVSQPGYSGGCYNRTTGGEVYTLRIDNVTEDMDGVTWQCQYFSTISRITLDVYVMVTQVSVQNLPSTVLAGISTTFTCVTSRSKPRACIRGYIRSSGNVRELGPTDCNQDSTYTSTTRITTRTLRFTATAEDNGAVLYCTADNSVTDPPVRSQNHTPDVQYPPVNGISLTTSYVNNTPIEPGANVTLTCQVGKGNPRPVLTWTPVCGQTNTDSGNDGSQQISISINVSPSLNRKSCVCKGTQDGALTGWSQQKSRMFNVLFGPDSVQLLSDSGHSENTVRVTENSTVTFTCNSSESNPASVLSWYNNSSPIPAAELSEVRSERGPNLGYLITQRYIVRVDRYQDGNVIRCEARRSDQTTPVYSSTLTLDIKYAPWFTTCPSSYILVENQTSADLSCSTWAKPDPRFTWSVRNQVLMDKTESGQDHRQTSVFTFNKVNRSNSGIYTVTVDNGVGRVQRNVNVTVYYAPDVNVVLVGNDTEGLSAKLECRADGRPENYTYSVWTHHIGDRPVPLIDNNPGRYLMIPKLTFWHQGIYRCGASNGFGGIHVGQSTEIKIKALPKFPSQDVIQTAALGENITLVIRFVSYPDYDKLMWYTNQSSEILKVSNTTGSKYRLRVREADHEFVINGIKILIPGHVAELRIHNVTREDFSQYRLTVTNNIGSSEDVINFRLIDRPSAPTSIDCKNAKLKWKSGFDGGSMQTFVVEYNKDGGDWKDWRSNITDPGEGKSVNVEIDNLGEGQYRFRVYGENRWNKSDTLEKSCKVTPGSTPASLVAIVAGVVSGAVVFVIVIVVIVVIIFKRKRQKGEESTRDSEKPSQQLTFSNGLSDGGGGGGAYAVVDDTESCLTKKQAVPLTAGIPGAYEDVDFPSKSSASVAPPGQLAEGNNENKNKKPEKEVPPGLYAPVDWSKKKKKPDKDLMKKQGSPVSAGALGDYEDVELPNNLSASDVPDGLYAEVDKKTKNKKPGKDVPDGLYAEVDKKTKNKKPGKDVPDGLYAEVDKKTKNKKPGKDVPAGLYAEVDKKTKKKKPGKDLPGKGKKKKKPGKDNVPADLYADVDNEETKDKPHTDDVPAGLYAEVDKGKKGKKPDTEVPAGLYAEVVKGQKAKTPEVPAGLYAEVNKGKKPHPNTAPGGPVYSEVSKTAKQPKGKPVVPRKLKPTYKKPEPKDKEDKMDLIEQKTEKAAVPSTTYANPGFDVDDMTYTNSGDVTEHGAREQARGGCGNNLIYADMAFDDKPVFHPNEQSTTYASISYGKVGPPVVYTDEEDEKDKTK